MRLRPHPRPFSLPRQPTPDSPALRRALSAASLALAADVFEAESALVGRPGPLPDPSEATAGRDDRATQSYLQEACDRTQISSEDVSLSASAARVGGNEVELKADRWALGAEAQAADGASVGASTLPFATVATVKVGQADAFAYAGKSLVGAKGAISEGPATAAIGLTLRVDDKVQVLGPTRTGPDGQTLHLARFSSSLAPVLDGDLSWVASHVGASLRVALGFGRATIYDKFLSTDELAKLMRGRDRWYRRLVETAHAFRLVAGVRPTSMQALARNISDIDTWLPGEQASWQSRHAIILGVGLSAFGGRLIATANVSGGVTFALTRDTEDYVTLRVEPLRQAGVRLSLEAKVLGDVAGDVGQSLRQSRAWRFHTGYMSSRHALSRALDGYLPGILLPATSPLRIAFSHANIHAAEAVPFGVEAATSSHAIDHVKSLSLGSLRLPELVGGQSLFIRTECTDSAGSETSSEGTSFSRSSTSSRAHGLLTLGDLAEDTRIEAISDARIKRSGHKHVAAKSLRATYRLESGNSGSFGRRRTAKKFSEAFGEEVLIQSKAKTRGYAVQLAVDLGLDDLEKIALASDEDLAAAAKVAGLPPGVSAEAKKMISAFVRHGHAEGVVAEMRFVAHHGYKGIRLLRALAGSTQDISIDVENIEHKQLMTDFLKAEIYAGGARDTHHAARALDRVNDLIGRLEVAQEEIIYDGALALCGPEVVTQQNKFISAIITESKALAADIEFGLLDAET